MDEIKFNNQSFPWTTVLLYSLLPLPLLCFLPMEQNYPLYLYQVFLAIAGFSLLRFSSGIKLRNHVFWAMFLLLNSVYILSLAVNFSNNSTLNSLLFWVTFFVPFSVPVFFSLMNLSSSIRTKMNRIFIVIVLVQFFFALYQWYTASFQIGDPIKGTSYHAHNLSTISFFLFCYFITDVLQNQKPRRVQYKIVIPLLVVLSAMIVFTSFKTLYVIGLLAAILSFLSLKVYKIAMKCNWRLPYLTSMFVILVCVGGVFGSYFEFAHAAKKTVRTSSSSSSASASTPTLDTVSFLGFELPTTAFQSKTELTEIQKSGRIPKQKLWFAGWVEAFHQLYKRGTVPFIFGLGPGNVNSRAANLRSRPWRTGEEVPIFDAYKNKEMEYFVFRWENPESYDTSLGGSILVKPFDSYRVLLLELGLLGFLAGLALFLVPFGYFLTNTFNISSVPHRFAAMTLILTVFGLAFFWNIFEIADIMGMFWLTLGLMWNRPHEESFG